MNNKNAIFVLDDFFGDDKYTHDMSAREAWDCIKRLLKEQGQIVRCKDCKWYQAGIDIHGKPFTRCNGDVRVYGHTKPDWFCADGERRTDNA